MITKDGRELLKEHIISTFTHYEVGTGGDSTNPNASFLDSPLGTRGTVTKVSAGDTTIDFTFTVQGSTFVGHTIKEVGIFNASTSGTMLVRVNYEGIGPLVSSQEIEFIITVEVD
tara:strand:- start:1900 stop:2244 length:345 start_codon:yes stop_codon:yes gene_type:complete